MFLNLNNSPILRPWLLPLILLAGMVSPGVVAEPRQGAGDMLSEDEYRGEIEEVIVTGRQPEWRTEQKPEWRPQRFELPEATDSGRMEWLPEYDRDERDKYDGVRDRMAEKPEIKLFEWKF